MGVGAGAGAGVGVVVVVFPPTFLQRNSRGPSACADAGQVEPTRIPNPSPPVAVARNPNPRPQAS